MRNQSCARKLFFTGLATMLAGPVFAHDQLSWGGTEFHIVLDAEGTEGKMGMFAIHAPGPGGPGMHVHEDADEAIYVIEGAAEFARNDERVTLGSGDAVFIPQGAEHTFHVTGENGARLLVVVAPGGFEGFFEAMVAEDLKIPEDMERIIEVSKGFGQVFTGPPLAAQ